MTQNKEWIEWKWTAEKPYPETLDTMVCVLFNDGVDEDSEDVEFWVDYPNTFDPNNKWRSSLGYITHYKLA